MTAKIYVMPSVAMITMALLLVFSTGSTCLAKPQSAADSAKAAEKSLPSPDEFIAVDVTPVAVNLPQPVYPDSAIAAKIEGSVWVKVLIDAQGAVKEALIAKSSGKKVGFEEAALAAARQSTWKPAMVKDKPVAVWVSYEVKFVLKGHK